MLVGPLFGPPLPLRACQILWISLLTHGLTGVAMGAEPTAPGTMVRPPRPPERHVLGGGAWQRLLLLALLAAQLGVVMGLRARLVTGENPFLPGAVLASARHVRSGRRSGGPARDEPPGHRDYGESGRGECRSRAGRDRRFLWSGRTPSPRMRGCRD